MQKIVENKAFLSRCASNPSIVKKANFDQISCLVDILYNLGSIPLTPKEKRSLSKQLSKIQSIAKCSREKKARESLIQHGRGLFPALIPAVLALIQLLKK